MTNDRPAGLSAYPPIEDYGLIGDCRSAALVSRHGSIDWLCLPRFDSRSFFGRLLDGTRGGDFSIRPTVPFSVHRHYENDSAVLVSELRTESGVVRLTDFVPALVEEDKRGRLLPFWSLIRRIEGLEGTVELDVTFRPHPDYGNVTLSFHRRGAAGYACDLGGRLLFLTTDCLLDVKPGEVSGRVTLRAGERHALWLAYSEDAPAVYPAPAHIDELLQKTLAYWQRWASQCTYQGPHRAAAIRSAITLKLLSFAPSGAIVAAPTTSLPEVMGGVRNWDYRLCWLRDASLTAKMFFQLGYHEEARAFIMWLMHATNLTYPRLQVLYDVYGHAHLPQHDLHHLEGYRGSSPVRIGNQAWCQYQLDVYGHVLDAVLVAVDYGFSLDRSMRRHVVDLANLVLDEWICPDHGIWEIPGKRRHYVHSKVQCWVALDRAIQLTRRTGLNVSTADWRQATATITDTVFRDGFSPRLRSFIQRFGSEGVDAAALSFPAAGFIDPADDRMRSTVAAIRSRLAAGDLLYRYDTDDGLPGKEGAFVACSFWLVEALHLLGQYDEAEAILARLLSKANDLGLYAEEIDPASGAFLGNFPQALTHLALIGAVLRLPQTS